MSLIQRYVIGVLALPILLITVPAIAQPATQNLPQSFDIQGLFDELKNVQFWAVLGVTVLFGALGGFVYELLALQGMIERSHKPSEEEVVDFPHATHKFVYDLGIWGRMIIGGMAAVIALWVIEPTSTFAWLAVAVVAGSAGTSIFQSMQDRLLAVIKSKEVDVLRADNQKIGELVQKLEDSAAQQGNQEMVRDAAAARALIKRGS